MQPQGAAHLLRERDSAQPWLPPPGAASSAFHRGAGPLESRRPQRSSARPFGTPAPAASRPPGLGVPSRREGEGRSELWRPQCSTGQPAGASRPHLTCRRAPPSAAAAAPAAPVPGGAGLRHVSSVSSAAPPRRSQRDSRPRAGASATCSAGGDVAGTGARRPAPCELGAVLPAPGRQKQKGKEELAPSPHPALPGG